MFEKPNRITLAGSEYPLKCDFAVLEQVQEKYGDLTKFEEKIRKFVPDLDAKGNLVRNKDGLIVGHYDFPDIKALLDFTYWCICEGCEIEEVEAPADRKALMRMIDMTPLELSEIMHAEYISAFARKNPQTTQEGTKAKKG